MRAGILVLASARLVAVSAEAQPYVLKCSDTKGGATVDMTVDLDTRTITWGKFYKISKVTDQYITAVEDEERMPSDVGGEVLVLDRVSGNYKFASVGLFCDKPPPLCTSNSRFETLTFSGKCARPMF